jgi:hypothetical protein
MFNLEYLNWPYHVNSIEFSPDFFVVQNGSPALKLGVFGKGLAQLTKIRPEQGKHGGPQTKRAFDFGHKSPLNH